MDLTKVPPFWLKRRFKGMISGQFDNIVVNDSSVMNAMKMGFGP